MVRLPPALLLVLAACSGDTAMSPTSGLPMAATDQGHTTTQPKSEPDIEDNIRLQPPFTEEQIREAMPRGTHWVFHTQNRDEPEVVQDWTVTAASETDVTIRFLEFHLDGKELKPAEIRTSLFSDLRDHASFDAHVTTLVEGTIDVPAGHYSTLVYTVTTTIDGGVTSVKTYHFGKDAPGPPVLFSVVVGGTPMFKMTSMVR